MAETTSTRLGLIRYGAGTDMLSRVDYNAAADALEALVAIDAHASGTGTATTVGRFYTDDSTGVTYRDNGSALVGVASNIRTASIKPATAAAVALTVQGVTSQVGNLVSVKNSIDTNFFSVAAEGDILTRGSRILIRGNPGSGEHILVLAPVQDQERVLSMVLPDTSTAPYIQAKKLTGAVTFAVDHLGVVTASGTSFATSTITGLLTAGSITGPTIITHATGTGVKLQLNNLTSIGLHSANNPYYRSGDSHYFYKGGTHSDTIGDPGSGGTLLLKVGLSGIHSTNTDTPVMDTNPYAITTGNLTGLNAIFGKSNIQARSNGSSADFGINRIGGGSVYIGHPTLSPASNQRGVNVNLIATALVDIDTPITRMRGTTLAAYNGGIFKINDHRLHIGMGEPEDPEPGDVWIEIDV